MNPDHSHQASAVYGALVADAASMGLHWLYDQTRIRELSGDDPAFTTTTAPDYQGVPAYYAHTHKTTGDFSQYGEQAIVMLQSLAQTDGHYRKSHYEQTFRAVFGYGGTYVGYIDRPTRDTLDAITRAEQQAIANARSLPHPGTPADQQAMINKVLANLQQHQGGELDRALEEAVRITHNDDAMVQYAQTLIEPLSSTSEHHGAHDDQLPALSKLPALIASCANDADLDAMVDSAVRVTNNHPLATECAQIMSRVLRCAFETRSVDNAINALDQCTGEQILPIIRNALTRVSEPSTDVIADIGMACNLTLGMPGAFHILKNTSTYADAVRTNIYAGGDSCGRAILIGAVAGAVYGTGGDSGIPKEWINKLNRLREVTQSMNQLDL